MSELLRVKQGCDQVAEQEDRDGEDGESCDAHGLPQLPAGGDVQKRNCEERKVEEDHQEVGNSVS
jgi:hypothetical protein